MIIILKQSGAVPETPAWNGQRQQKRNPRKQSLQKTINADDPPVPACGVTYGFSGECGKTSSSREQCWQILGYADGKSDSRSDEQGFQKQRQFDMEQNPQWRSAQTLSDLVSFPAKREIYFMLSHRYH